MIIYCPTREKHIWGSLDDVKVGGLGDKNKQLWDVVSLSDE